MEFTFDVSQTPVIGRRYLKGSGMVVLPGQISAGSSTVSSATSDSLQDREQVKVFTLKICLMSFFFICVIFEGIFICLQI